MLRALFVRAKYTYQTKGLLALSRRVLNFLFWRFRFLVRYFFEYQAVYLYEHTIKERNEADFMPKVHDFTLQKISKNQHTDELPNSFQDFRSYWLNARRRMEKGLIIFYGSVGRERAAIGWIAMTEEAKKTFDRRPYHVDFSANEACVGIWVEPKYRGKGLATYVYFKMFQFLLEIGVKKCRASVRIANVASQRLQAKFGPKMYAKLHCLRIIGRYLRKEVPLRQTD